MEPRPVPSGTASCAAARAIAAAEWVTAEMLAELRRLAPFAPQHEPSEIALLEAFERHYPRRARRTSVIAARRRRRARPIVPARAAAIARIRTGMIGATIAPPGPFL
jgi:hypothetical protein